MAENTENQNGNPGVIGAANVGITTEQLHQAIEKARLEERTKLHGTITELQGKLTTQTTATTEMQTKLREADSAIADLTGKFTALKSSIKETGGVDIDGVIQKVMENFKQRVDGETAAQLSELRGALKEEQTKRELAERNNLRSRLIAEAGGEQVMITDLVRGDTPEEIRASIDYAKGLFTKIRGTATPGSQQSNNGSTGGNGSASGAPPSLPGAGGSAGTGNADGGITPDALRSMSNKEWAENRMKLRKQVSSRYAGDILRTS